ncbi:MAG: Hpt domain-containing protein [Blautia sp.]|nr:Hpt domain-containing protein [Blautia sp.]
MTLQELYQEMGADYEMAIRILRMDKLIDKHIRRFAGNEVIKGLLQAGEAMDPAELFDKAHAAKGVCANLGLSKLSDLVTVISEEYRPGNARTRSDEEVKQILEEIQRVYELSIEKIRQYAEA